MTLVLLILALHERDLIGGGTRSTRGEMETVTFLYKNYMHPSFSFFFHNNVVRPGIKNKNVKIKCSGHDAFLE